MVLFDATTLLVLLSPEAAVPKDLSGKAIPYARERLARISHRIRRTKAIQGEKVELVERLGLPLRGRPGPTVCFSALNGMPF